MTDFVTRDVHRGVGNIDTCIDYSIESSVGSDVGEVSPVGLTVNIGWSSWHCTIRGWCFGNPHTVEV